MKSLRFLYIVHLFLLIIRTFFIFRNFIDHNNISTIPENNIISNWWNSFFIEKTDEKETENITELLGEKDTFSGDTNLSSSDTISLNDIIESLSKQENDGTFVSTKELEQQYRSSKDPEKGVEYIKRLTKEFNYKDAYKELQSLDSITIKGMDPHLVLRIFFNSELISKKTQNLTLIENMIGEFSTNNLISKEETQRYKSLLLLIKGDKKNFFVNLPSIGNNNTSEIKGVVNDIRNKINKANQGHDIPAYYTDGMITLSLFQYGYPYLSQQISLDILSQYPNYILPQQILAYSHMILHEWSQAQSYFLQLINNDNKNIHNYQFFAGVCSYWLGKYPDAILYLNQIPTNKIVSDAIRYKILSYIAIEDYTNTAKQMKFLLGQTDVNNSDMMLMRENLVFIPYMYGKSYNILSKDPNLLDLYIERCENQKFDPIICQIGKLAKDVNLRLMNYSDSYLKEIIIKFPRSYIYFLLGEYYSKKGNNQEAKKAYISALSLSTDNEVRKKITNRIQGIL